MKRFLLPSLLIAALAGFTVQGAAADTVTVDNAYAFATTAAQKNGAAFLDIRNSGNADDALLSASTNAADAVEIHVMEMKDGTMVMRPVNRVTVPGQGQAQLAPTGTHIMLMGLKEPLTAGQNFALGLTFEKAGSVPVAVDVVPAGTTPSMHGDSHGHGHGDAHGGAKQPIPQDSTADWFHRKSGHP